MGRSIRSLAVGLGICSTAMLAVLAVLWGVGLNSSQWQAAVVATGICWFAVLPGLGLFACREDAEWKLMSAGVAIVVRMMVCLGALAAFQVLQHPLARAGVSGMLVISYLVMLVAETAYFLLFAGPGSPPADVGSGRASPDQAGSEGASQVGDPRVRDSQKVDDVTSQMAGQD